MKNQWFTYEDFTEGEDVRAKLMREGKIPADAENVKFEFATLKPITHLVEELKDLAVFFDYMFKQSGGTTADKETAMRIRGNMSDSEISALMANMLFEGYRAAREIRRIQKED